MDYKRITKEYYSSWLGFDMDTVVSGMEYVYSKERNLVQPGHGCRYDLWIWIDDNRWIISYGDKVKEDMIVSQKLFSGIKASDDLIRIVKEKFDCRISHGIKYIYCAGKTGSDIAKVLEEKDYTLYKSFFQKCNPKCKDIGWLKDYFMEMVQSEMCCGSI